MSCVQKTGRVSTADSATRCNADVLRATDGKAAITGSNGVCGCKSGWIGEAMLKLMCQRPIWTQNVDVCVFGQEGSAQWVGGLVKQEYKDGEYISEPTLRLKNQEAQELMDALWHVGLRPSEGTGSAGSLAATERHLKDMQTIAMGLLRKEF
jgi:hypothetical protein